MAFDVETPSETQAKVRVRVAPDDVAGAVEHEMGHLKERVRLKGFRPGKVPKQILQKRYGGDLSADVARRLIEDEVKEAISQHHLHPVEPPVLKEDDLKRKEDGSLEVLLELEVVPDFPLGSYEKFSITPPPIRLSDEDVARELEGLRRQGATTE